MSPDHVVGARYGEASLALSYVRSRVLHVRAEDPSTIVFGDPNDATRFIEHVALVKTHTNVDTGFTLSEFDHFTIEFNAGTERVGQMGIFWHLRDPSGNLVVVQAGQVLFDTGTGELLKMTPNVNPDFAAVICPALGGSPA
jgi:hypothetical protein